MKKIALTLAASLAALTLANAVQAKPNVAEVTARAEQGVVEAQYALGTIYLKGNGVKQDAKKALHWYLKAADQNSAMAQIKLGFMYEDGNGVQKDMKKAKEWYQKACDNKHELGCSYAQRLADDGY